MRLGVVIAVVGLSGLLMLGLHAIFPPQAIPSATPAPANSVPERAPEASASELAPRPDPTSPTDAIARREESSSSALQRDTDAPDEEEVRAASLAARLESLRQLAARTDGASLETLLLELSNSDREVRHAILELILQAGNRAAIPGLEALAARVEHPAEQQELLDAVEFLKLPTLTETLNQVSRATNSSGR